MGWRFLHAYAGLLVVATMIAVFACWGLKQKGNEEAMLMARDRGRRDLSSPTTLGPSTIRWILQTSACRTWARFSHQLGS